MRQEFHVGFQNLKPYKATVSGTKSVVCLLLITGELSRHRHAGGLWSGTSRWPIRTKDGVY